MRQRALDDGRLYAYDAGFYAYQQHGSLAAARRVLPLVAKALTPTSVLDVGCGAGAWCRAWQELRVHDVAGVDGSYLQPRQLLFDPAAFIAADVSRPLRLGRRFDLVQCLEVAEHLDPSASRTLVENLVTHAPMVLFSAAPPGQGGENHVNEQPYEFWRDLFQEHGYLLLDFLRPKLAPLREVEPWYRYNLLLFVHRDQLASLPAALRASCLDPAQPVPDVSPWAYRLRKRLLAALPPAWVTMLARAKHGALRWTQRA